MQFCFVQIRFAFCKSGLPYANHVCFCKSGLPYANHVCFCKSGLPYANHVCFCKSGLSYTNHIWLSQTISGLTLIWSGTYALTCSSAPNLHIFMQRPQPLHIVASMRMLPSSFLVRAGQPGCRQAPQWTHLSGTGCTL